ncbi:MAG: hypothetical protein VB858_03490 [Planctomycetaceae bacterium]
MPYNKFDARLEELIVETRTAWSPAVGDLSDEDRNLVASAIHSSPELASEIEYERVHTGFARQITVTVEDIQRLYQQRLSG